MPKRFYKFKLLLDENMPPRQRFPRLNSRFDVKHIRDDFNQTSLKDPAVYDLAVKLNRLVVTFNGDDFENKADKSNDSGIINVSANMRYEQIDTKLTALLVKSTPNALYGKFTEITGETEVLKDRQLSVFFLLLPLEMQAEDGFVHNTGKEKDLFDLFRFGNSA